MNYQFSFRHEGVMTVPPAPDCHFKCQIDCKIDGILRFVAMTNRKVLSKAVFRLIERPAGKEQNLMRDLGDDQYRVGRSKPEVCRGFYVLYHKEDSNKPRSKGKQRKAAVVTFLNRDTLLFAIVNLNYSLDNPDCYLLHRNN
jgi:hypothetical protein